VVNQALQVMPCPAALPNAHLQGIQSQAVVIDLAARQPVIIRENTSMQNATETNPTQVAT